jgi:protein-disulfide isomerase
MNKRFLFLALAILLASLFTGAAASGAQTPLTETYTWQPNGLAIRYPGGWTVVQKETAISLRPADRDVSDGRGPELVLFSAPGTRASRLDAALASIASEAGATSGAATGGTLNGYPTLSAELTWTNPDATGAMILIALDDQTVIGLAYVVRTEDRAAFLPVLQQMAASLTFDRAVAVAGTENSTSTASVQLPQRYVWQQTGLVLYLPESWQVDLKHGAQGETLLATPDPATARGDDLYQVLQGLIVEGMDGLDLQSVAVATAIDYQVTSDFVETTVAGQPGITYDLLDDSAEPALHLRPLIVSLPDGRMALFVFGARDTAWERFRPAVSAISSSIELASNSAALSTPMPDAARLLVSRPQQQNDSPTQYTWESYDIGFTLPDGWQATPGNGQDYDLALVSPEAMQTGQGAFITLLGYPGLATGGNTFEAALQPVADQLKAEIKPYSVAGLEGVSIDYTDETQQAQRHFILIPYGTRGDAIYIQTTAPLGGDDVITSILDSMTVHEIVPDYAAVDAAWQTSLAEQGKLIVGDANAPVKMREYLSFTCGHCVHYSRTIERLIALEVETGRVQYEFAPIAGDAFAHDGAMATYCAAEQGKGFSASEALFQSDMEQDYTVAYSREGIDAALSPLGVDIDALNACIDAGKYEEQIQAVTTGFYDQGLTGTPTVTLGAGNDPPEAITLPNGQVWSGTIPLHFLLDIFHAVIDDGLTIQEYFQQ